MYISQLLNATHTLEAINIANNDIGDDGIAVISEALQHNKSLTKLWIGRCGLSGKGIIIKFNFIIEFTCIIILIHIILSIVKC